jgi:hypothetical protein
MNAIVFFTGQDNSGREYVLEKHETGRYEPAIEAMHSPVSRRGSGSAE